MCLQETAREHTANAVLQVMEQSTLRMECQGKPFSARTCEWNSHIRTFQESAKQRHFQTRLHITPQLLSAAATGEEETKAICLPFHWSVSEGVRDERPKGKEGVVGRCRDTDTRADSGWRTMPGTTREVAKKK